MFRDILFRAFSATLTYGGSMDAFTQWATAIENNKHPLGKSLDESMIQVGCTDKEILVKRLYNFYVKQLIYNSQYEKNRRDKHTAEWDRKQREYFRRNGHPQVVFSVNYQMPLPSRVRYESEYYSNVSNDDCPTL